MAAEHRPAPDDIDALDLTRLFHPNTNLASHHEIGPLTLARGEGIHVWDTRGNRYIEAMAGLWCTTLGYGNEELVEAALEQLRRLAFTHLFVGKSHEPVVRLASRLVDLAPFDAGRVFFGLTGSDANDTQVKFVWYYNNAIGRPRKKKIISRHRAYHGTTVASASLSGLPAFHDGFDVPLAGFLHADSPYMYRDAEPGESEEAYATRLAENLERLILAEGPDTVAAFIAEPVMGVGGMLIPPATYFEKVQAVLAKYDVLLIDDEVITGFGRTGRLWGAETYGMQPTTLTAAKALSSGYLPISAVILPEFMYEPILEHSKGVFGHGFTYSGHPVAAAVALKALEIYERDGIYERVRVLGSGFQRRLAACADHPLVGDARGVGLVGACELVRDKRTKAGFDADTAIATRVMHACQRHGLIVRAIGECVVLCPPYIVTESDIDEIFELFERGLNDTLDWARKERLV